MPQCRAVSGLTRLALVQSRRRPPGEAVFRSARNGFCSWCPGPAKGGQPADDICFKTLLNVRIIRLPQPTRIPSSPIERCKFASPGAGGQDVRAFRRGYAAACSLRLPFPRSPCLPLCLLWLRTASVSGRTPYPDREYGSEHLEVRPETQPPGPIQT